MTRINERTINYNYLDVLRFFACFAVILLHYSGSYTYRLEIPPFKTGVQFFTATRWCVPIFLMVSGALSLGKNYDIAQFYKKRFVRLLPPFFFWSFIYIAFKIYRGETEVSNIPKLLTNGAEFHLWYVYTIIGIILFLPFLTHWTEKQNKKSLVIFLFIWMYWLISTNQYTQIAVGLDLSCFAGYIGYLVLGYYLHILSSKSYHLLIGLGFLCIGLAYSYYSTMQLSQEIKQFSDQNQRYLSWNVLLMSIGVFLIAKQIKLPGSLLVIIKEAAKYSFSIYLAHIFVRDNLVKDYLDFAQLNYYFFLIVKAIIVFCVSYLLAKILSKLPFIGPVITG